MRTIAIYGGRFQIFHLGHKSVYDHLVKQFGSDNVYIVSSNKQAPVSSPFSFDDKTKMMQALKIPQDHIIQVKNPYQAKEVTDQVDGQNTSIVFALSAKDAERFTFKPKKDGSPSYMQPYPGNDNLKPLTETGYILVVPTINFEVLGNSVKSASAIRGMYLKSNDNDRIKILKDLYGKATKQMKSLFDKQLSITETFLNLYNNTTLLESKSILRRKQIITKARILESKISKEEFNFKK